MIVESPTKATKIQKFLGDEYKVQSVMLVSHKRAAD
jgi:DNA topoisomerase IA